MTYVFAFLAENQTLSTAYLALSQMNMKLKWPMDSQMNKIKSNFFIMENLVRLQK